MKSQLSLGSSSSNGDDDVHDAQEDKQQQRIIKLLKQRNSADSIRSSSSKNLSSNLTTYLNLIELKIFEGIARNVTDQHVYCTIATKVKSVFEFVKVAYPDLVGGDGLGKLEPLNSKDRKVCRSKLLTCVDRGLHPGSTMHETVFDLDALTNNHSNQTSQNEERLLCNWDELRVGKRGNDSKQLQFESRFESGNLRKVIQV